MAILIGALSRTQETWKLSLAFVTLSVSGYAMEMIFPCRQLGGSNSVHEAARVQRYLLRSSNLECEGTDLVIVLLFEAYQDCQFIQRGSSMFLSSSHLLGCVTTPS